MSVTAGSEQARGDSAAPRRQRKAAAAPLLTSSPLFSSLMSRQYMSAFHNCRA
jgi:hypothetical protein